MSIDDAEPWYFNLFGSGVEVFHPVPGVVELFQIYEAGEQQAAGNIVRFFSR
ncbi:hypothetical protein [Phaeobacter porticola]|uniref:hypothetical protein n=1 Tax=Phaeobacter porticola TaxID=1844006 RepID=UPI000AA23152|nr:hypothetical protein [Phaeobacter porticola]